MLPSKADRRVRRATTENLMKYRNAPPAEIDLRLWELEREWDIERAIGAAAASISLAGVLLALVKHKAFLVLPAAAGAFLLQHARRRWSPPAPLLRRLGFRTQLEIEAERLVLRRLKTPF